MNMLIQYAHEYSEWIFNPMHYTGIYYIYIYTGCPQKNWSLLKAYNFLNICRGTMKQISFESFTLQVLSGVYT